MIDKIGLEKLKEDDDGELFWIIFVDGEKVGRNGYVRSTSSPMREPEVREFFEKGQQPASDVEAMFQLARQGFQATNKTQAAS